MEKLSSKESVEGVNTMLRGSARAPEGFSEGKPEAAKQREGVGSFSTLPHGSSTVTQTTNIMRFTGE